MLYTQNSEGLSPGSFHIHNMFLTFAIVIIGHQMPSLKQILDMFLCNYTQEMYGICNTWPTKNMLNISAPICPELIIASE